MKFSMLPGSPPSTPYCRVQPVESPSGQERGYGDTLDRQVPGRCWWRDATSFRLRSKRAVKPGNATGRQMVLTSFNARCLARLKDPAAAALSTSTPLGRTASAASHNQLVRMYGVALLYDHIKLQPVFLENERVG